MRILTVKSKIVRSRRTAVGLSVAVSLLLGAASAGDSRELADNSTAAKSVLISPLEVRYTLDIPGNGEIFPALASGSPAQYWPIANLTIVNNSSRQLAETVWAEIPGWSRQSVQTFNLRPNEGRTLRLNPELLPEAFAISEIRRATLAVHATILGTALGYNETRPLYIHAASDFFWGANLANAQSIARWVTPHDPAVLQLVSSARKYVRRGRLAGYRLPGTSAAGVRAQVQVEDDARGIFAAMQHLGFSYVDNISTYGNFTSTSERVRLPGETLSMNGANCIDLSVAFASAMENLGMEPVIVLVPGHASSGVRLAPGSLRILYLDLTFLPDGTFDAGMSRARNWLQKTPKALVKLIDIAVAPDASDLSHAGKHPNSRSS